MVYNDEYYHGYEGEPEIVFDLFNDGTCIEKISIWDGYFNGIMDLISPKKDGWTGLAYYYHLCIGWYEEENWEIPNILEVYEQFSEIDFNELKWEEEKAVFNILICLFEKAIEINGKILITYN